MKLMMLDCDGTIREPLSGAKFIQHPRDQKIIDGADKAIVHYRAQGWLVVGISNQGGVGAGHKSLQEAINEQLYTLSLLPELRNIYFCPDLKGKHCWLASKKIDDARPIHIAWAAQWAGLFRKPNPGMIYAALLNHCNGNQPNECLFVGDRSEDEQAAAAAGIRFMWATDWRSQNK